MLIQQLILIAGLSVVEPVQVGDLVAFPEREQSMIYWKTAFEALKSTTKPLPAYHPFPEWVEYYNWLQKRELAWDLLTDAQNPWRVEEERRGKLYRLRRVIGYNNYILGIMP